MEREVKQLYLLKEVADILRLSQRTLYTYIKEKRIKATKIGNKWKITEEDLREFITRPY